MKIEKEIMIKALPEEVFDYISDPRKIPDWIEGIERVEITSEGKGNGMTYRRHFKSKRYRLSLIKLRETIGEDSDEYQITEWVKNKKLAFRRISESKLLYFFPIRIEESYMLKPVHKKTELTYNSEYSVGLLDRLFYRLLDPLGLVEKEFKKVTEKKVERSLNSLKNRLEESSQIRQHL
ncbi:MAG: SRPBCC family protein [Methanobacteriota archaeon]